MGYWYRSAFTGSSRVARRAGQKQAITATVTMTRLIATSVTTIGRAGGDEHAL